MSFSVVSGEGLFLHRGLELLRRLERRNVRLGNHDGRVLRDVAGGLGGAVLDTEGAEATEVNGFSLDEGALDGLHYAFNSGRNGRLLNACGLGHGGY